jgi:DNA-binding response OmpR family regulator
MAKKKILVVDDDPLARKILHAALGRDYDVVVSGDAMAAFTEARKQSPDLVILDLGLPAGGGFTVLQRLKSIPALSVVPVVVVSGLDREVNEPKALAEGANAFLSKPVNKDQVLAIVTELLAS